MLELIIKINNMRGDIMKKEYVKPQIFGEKFVANEYVAACYHGVCNISGYVFTDVNGNGTYDKGVDTYKYKNTACNHDYWIEGQSSTLPAKNAFIFPSCEVEEVLVREGYWMGLIYIFPKYDLVTVGKGDPTQVWNFDEEHTTTTMDLQNRPNHS